MPIKIDSERRKKVAKLLYNTFSISGIQWKKRLTTVTSDVPPLQGFQGVAGISLVIILCHPFGIRKYYGEDSELTKIPLLEGYFFNFLSSKP